MRTAVQGTANPQRTHPSPWKQTGNQLNQILLSEGKYDELQKASKDKEYQKKLLAEYGLLNEKQGE